MTRQRYELLELPFESNTELTDVSRRCQRKHFQKFQEKLQRRLVFLRLKMKTTLKEKQPLIACALQADGISLSVSRAEEPEL